jgi:ketosteroid isomerase-like protein
MIRKTIMFSSALFFFTSSFAQTSVVEQIKALNSAMEKSFMDNDMLKVASFYADTALISGGGRMNVYGRKAIDQYWVSLKDKGAQWKLEVDSVEEFGSYVLQRGRSYLKFKGSDGVERQSNVRFFIVWKKAGDSYKILNDTFTRL